jgi:hypothetical protein
MSDQPRRGHVLAEEGMNWLNVWKQKIQPEQITITGGEPLLNPDIVLWCQLIRDTWPQCHVVIQSNGSNLKRSKIIPALTQIGNITLVLTCHHHSINLGFAMFQDEMIKEIDADSDWQHADLTGETVLVKLTKQTACIKVGIQETYTRPYNGVGASMRPWKSKSIEMSHAICATPEHPVLYQNKLYKCLPVANLRDTLTMHKMDKNAAWWDYLQYNGFGPEDDLSEFFADVGKPNQKTCTMCSENIALCQFKHYELGNVGQKITIYPSWSQKPSTPATI